MIQHLSIHLTFQEIPSHIALLELILEFRRDAGQRTNEGDIRTGFYTAYNAAGCEYIRLADPEIDRRLKNGPDLVSASFVIPYPPGFPIMVPGQVITQETIDFMRKLDVKEIHGYDATEGLKLVRTEALAKLVWGQAAPAKSKPAAEAANVNKISARK